MCYIVHRDRKKTANNLIYFDLFLKKEMNDNHLNSILFIIKKKLRSKFLQFSYCVIDLSHTDF